MSTITIDQIGCLIVRGISLLLAFTVLSSAAVVVQISTNPAPSDDGISKILFLFPYIMNSLLAILTWVFAPQLAKKMLPATSESTAPFTLQNILIVMLVAVGFMLLQDAVKHTLSMVVHIANVINGIQSIRVDDILSALIMLGIALSLIFKPQGIARMIKYARTAGGE